MTNKPLISLICAMANHRVIGLNNQMPWHMPADLKHFKVITSGKPVIMGRKTFESIGKPLPNRRNMIVSRTKQNSSDDVEFFSCIDSAIHAAEHEEEIMIIGGANIYQQTLNKAHRLYLTFIDLTTDGDAFFPEYQHLNLKEIKKEQHSADEKNPYDYQFITYDVIE